MAAVLTCGGTTLLENGAASGNENPMFLRVMLEGSASNREGLSSSVEVVLDGFRMERRVRTGSSYLSQSELPVTFGLGSRSAADSLIGPVAQRRRGSLR